MMVNAVICNDTWIKYQYDNINQTQCTWHASLSLLPIFPAHIIVSSTQPEGKASAQLARVIIGMLVTRSSWVLLPTQNTSHVKNTSPNIACFKQRPLTSPGRQTDEASSSW